MPRQTSILANECQFNNRRAYRAGSPRILASAGRSGCRFGSAAMTYAGFALMAVGLVVYLAAFAQGAGPTMGDRPLQATLFTVATVLLAAGLLIVVI